MAAHATLSERFVLENKRSALRSVTLEAGFVLAEQGGSAALERLGKIRSAAFDRVPFVRIMAIGATDFPLEHRMMMRQIEFRLHLQVALETSRRRLARINDGPRRATAFHVQTSRPVTRFAANVLRIGAFRFQARVRRRRETFRDRFMARCAFFRADKLRARNTGRRHDRAARFEVAAGKKDNR